LVGWLAGWLLGGFIIYIDAMMAAHDVMLLVLSMFHELNSSDAELLTFATLPHQQPSNPQSAHLVYGRLGGWEVG
jgi:hypothetical protein